MAGHTQTLYRQWLVLQMIPRAPRKVSAREIVERLHAEGQDATKRTVERDLIALSSIFPLQADERAKPYGWSYAAEAAGFSLPGMSPLQAIVLRLARSHLGRLLPAHLDEALQPYFRQADQVLAGVGRDGHRFDWDRHVAMVEPTQPLLPPTIDGGVLETVHVALDCGQRLRLTYDSRSQQQTLHYTVNPLGLVYRGAVGYLVATIVPYDDPRQFALHRIRAAEILDEAATHPGGFDLPTYARSGAFGFLDEGPIALVLRMQRPAAQHLYETPLSADQRIDDDGPDHVRIHATVNLTSQLRWWILGFGGQVEVISPANLKAEIASTLRSAVNRIMQAELRNETY
ncbi:helix-turn-helix transcriptional regulator [Metallibacterium sp.]